MSDVGNEGAKRRRGLLLKGALGCGAVLLIVIGVAAAVVVPKVQRLFRQPSYSERPEVMLPGDLSFLKQRLEERAANAVHAPGMGVSVAVVDARGIVWAEGYGEIGDEAHTPADIKTMYNAGVFTKPVIAAAVMKLAEQGRIDLDRPFSEYLGGFELRDRFPEAPPITIRHMLCHHSGMPTDYLRGRFRAERMPREEFIAGLEREYAEAPPGKIYAYSNVAYGLLGYMIEDLTGTDLTTALRELVFEPAGMRTATFEYREDVGAPWAQRYRRPDDDDDGEEDDLDGDNDDDGVTRVRTPARCPAADGLYASVGDMVALVQMLLQDGQGLEGRVLAPESVAEMFRAQNAGNPYDNGREVGLAWHLTWPAIDYLGDVAWHCGQTMRFNGYVVLALEHKIGVVVLGNFGNDHKFRHMAVDALQLAVEAKTGVRAPEEKPKADEDGEMSPLPAVPEAMLESIPGHYSTFMGCLKTERVGDGLRMYAQGRSADLIYKPDEQRFGIRYRLGGMIPLDLPFLDEFGVWFYEAEGERMFVFLEGPRFTMGKRIEPVPLPQAWLDRLGYYEVTNRGDDREYIKSVELKIEDAFLVAEIGITFIESERLRVALEPVSDTLAVVAGLGRRQGDAVEVVIVDGEERGRYSGYEFKRVRGRR